MLISFEPFCMSSHPFALLSHLSVCLPVNLSPSAPPPVTHFFRHGGGNFWHKSPVLLNGRGALSPIPLFAMRRNGMKRPEDGSA